MDYIIFLIMSIVFFILLFVFPGLLLYKGQPNEPNNLIGFRTKLSSHSNETWKYANNLAGKLILIYGLIYLFINIIIFTLMNIMALSDKFTIYMFYIQAGLFVAFYVMMFFKVQNNLKKYFDTENKKRYRK